MRKIRAIIQETADAAWALLFGISATIFMVGVVAIVIVLGAASMLAVYSWFGGAMDASEPLAALVDIGKTVATVTASAMLLTIVSAGLRW